MELGCEGERPLEVSPGSASQGLLRSQEPKEDQAWVGEGSYQEKNHRPDGQAQRSSAFVRRKF